MGVVAAQFKDGDGNDVGKIYHTGTGLFYNTGATGGIEFTNGGAANTLDDYEEGTWTPTEGADWSSFGTWSGTYTKIGRVVTIQGRMTGGTAQASSTNASITGLPFSCTTSLGRPIGNWADENLTAADWTFLIAGDTTLYVQDVQSSDTNFQFNVTYFTS